MASPAAGGTGVGADVLTHADAQARAAVVSNVRYAVHLELSDDPQQQTFGSITIARFDAADGASTFMNLAARSAQIWLNGRLLDPSDFDGERIRLTGLRATDNEVKVVARPQYQSGGGGGPFGHGGLQRLQDPNDGSFYLYSDAEPFGAHRVFASFDQPDLKAPMTMSVTAPSQWAVISNTKQLRATSTPNGTTTHHFATTEPISTYLDTIIAGPYEHVTSTYTSKVSGKDIDLGLWVRKSLVPYMDADRLFGITKQGLAFYEEFFGMPYPFDKYDQLFVPAFHAGAMENPGAVTVAESVLLTRDDHENRTQGEILLHEMAHMWFGDLVTMKWWGDLWLNESFATFMSGLAMNAISQQGTVTFPNPELSMVDRARDAIALDSGWNTHPIVIDATDTGVAMHSFDAITYGKGSAVLRQLYEVIGHDQFRDGIRAYMQKYRWGNASLNNLLGELESASGRDLKDWAKRWLQTSGVNTLAPEVVFDNGVIRSLAISQTADAKHPTLRPHRVGVGLYTAGPDGRLSLSERVVVDVDGPRTDVSKAFAGKRADAILLNDGNLTFARVRLDPQSLRTFQRYSRDLRDPIVRVNIADAARTPSRGWSSQLAA